MVPGSSEADMEKQFKMLEAGNSVDAELAKMKGLLGGSSDDESSSSGGGGSATGKSDPLDDEIARMKKDAGL